MIPAMQLASAQTITKEGRVALAIKLPRQIHLRMREIALRRDQPVSDLYQQFLEPMLDRKLPGEPYLRGPPTNADTVTLWLQTDFAKRFKATLAQRHLKATDVVLTTLLEKFGEAELLTA